MVSKNCSISKYAGCPLQKYPLEKKKNYLLAVVLKTFETLEQAAIFYFLLPIGRESIAFGSNFTNGNFWWIYSFWGSLNPGITFLAVGLCVCGSAFSIMQKEIITKTPCLKLFIWIICRCYLKRFYENWTNNLYTGTCKWILYITYYG